VRKLLPSALLLLAGITIALALAEGMVRIFAPYTRDNVIPAGMFEIDSHLGWKLRPATERRHRTRSFDVVYRINSMGFRDPPRTAARATGKQRVLFFGDSQIFGWGVAQDQSTSSVIEAAVPSMEVWNMGVPGYGLDQEILSYERNGGSLNATDVIFYVSTLTLSRSQTSFIFDKQKPRFVVDSVGKLELVPIRESSSTRASIVYRILSPLYLPYFVKAQIKRLKKRDPVRARSRDESAPVQADIVRLQKALLLKARAIADDRNQRMFVLATLPEPSAKELKDFCDQNRITLVMTPWVVTPSHLWVGKYDGHWGPRGHQLVAAPLLTQLEVAKDSRTK
jgi:hypothetical protein